MLCFERISSILTVFLHIVQPELSRAMASGMRQYFQLISLPLVALMMQRSVQMPTEFGKYESINVLVRQVYRSESSQTVVGLSF